MFEEKYKETAYSRELCKRWDSGETPYCFCKVTHEEVYSIIHLIRVLRRTVDKTDFNLDEKRALWFAIDDLKLLYDSINHSSGGIFFVVLPCVTQLKRILRGIADLFDDYCDDFMTTVRILNQIAEVEEIYNKYLYMLEKKELKRKENEK